MRPVRKLILIYDADSGFVNAMADSARKLFGFKSCSLCNITHGLAGERDAWRDCREEIGLPIEALHRDELSAELEELTAGRLPSVVAETEEGLETLLDPEVLDRCRRSVDDFKDELKAHAAKRDLDLPL